MNISDASVIKDGFTRSKDAISKVSFHSSESNEVLIEAYVLPENIQQWLSFISGKQRTADCQEVLLLRTDTVTKKRINTSEELLRGGTHVMVVGLPGIGKSSELNYLLMRFLQHLGQKGWPSCVLFHIVSKMFESMTTEIFPFSSIH